MCRRRAWLVAGAIALLALLAACGGGTDTAMRVGVTPIPQPEGTVTAIPSTGFALSCDAVQNIASFRYTIRLKLEIPGLPAPPGAADQGLLGPTEEPLGALASIVLGLFRDLKVEGAFVAPDRSRAILEVGGEEVEVRTIGDRSWVRFGDVWQEETAPTEVVFLSPQTMCEEMVPELRALLANAPWSPQTINGVPARHYHLDEADVPGLAGLLGAAEDAELPEEFRVDFWLAERGGWPVRLQMEASGRDEQGPPVNLELFLELRDLNSPDIEIEPPQVIGGQV